MNVWRALKKATKKGVKAEKIPLKVKDIKIIKPAHRGGGKKKHEQKKLSRRRHRASAGALAKAILGKTKATAKKVSAKAVFKKEKDHKKEKLTKTVAKAKIANQKLKPVNKKTHPLIWFARERNAKADKSKNDIQQKKWRSEAANALDKFKSAQLARKLGNDKKQGFQKLSKVLKTRASASRTRTRTRTRTTRTRGKTVVTRTRTRRHRSEEDQKMKDLAESLADEAKEGPRDDDMPDDA